jgi:hypothetical protein
MTLANKRLHLARRGSMFSLHALALTSAASARR